MHALHIEPQSVGHSRVQTHHGNDGNGSINKGIYGAVVLGEILERPRKVTELVLLVEVRENEQRKVPQSCKDPTSCSSDFELVHGKSSFVAVWLHDGVVALDGDGYKCVDGAQSAYPREDFTGQQFTHVRSSGASGVSVGMAEDISETQCCN